MPQRNLQRRTPGDMRRYYPIEGCLNGWYFRREETSNGAWLVEGSNVWGSKVSRSGSDPEALLNQCVHDAQSLIAQMRTGRLKKLLDVLCTDLGFCLPPQQLARIEAEEWVDVVALTDAVFMAEGLNPQAADRHLYRQVRQHVAEALDEIESYDA